MFQHYRVRQEKSINAKTYCHDPCTYNQLKSTSLNRYVVMFCFGMWPGELDQDLLTFPEESGGNEAIVNAEGSTEIQDGQLEDDQLVQGTNVDKQDFHGASSE